MSPTNRRSLEVRGLVNFPVADPHYRNSREGGMFVRLVVDLPEGWMVCCGGGAQVIYDECLQGDDRHPEPADLGDSFTPEELTAHYRTPPPAEAFHFPAFAERNEPHKHGKGDLGPYLSREYALAATIGSTGWSGWDDTACTYWRCRVDDLTPEGRALYELVGRIYGPEHVYLQTWLDT